MGEGEERILADCKAYAEKKGFSLNPDGKILNALIASLAKSEQEKGKRYCPCRALTGNREEDEKIVCPCVFHKRELEEDGHCRCMLFFKK